MIEVDVSAPIESNGVAVLDFQMEVVYDAAQKAMRYWRNALWAVPHEPYAPDVVLYEHFGTKYGYGGIEEAWHPWFVVLTSDEYFRVVTGLDLERIGDNYGKTANRT